MRNNKIIMNKVKNDVKYSFLSTVKIDL